MPQQRGLVFSLCASCCKRVRPCSCTRIIYPEGKQSSISTPKAAKRLHPTSSNAIYRPPVNVPSAIISSKSTAAPGTARLHVRALPDLHGWLVVDCGVAHPLLDLTRHGQEGLLDVARVLGRRLEERDSETVGELLLISSAFPLHSGG